MTDQTSRTPLEEAIAEAQLGDTPEDKLVLALHSLLRDASTNCIIDGYRRMDTENPVEWEVHVAGTKLRLMLIELP